MLGILSALENRSGSRGNYYSYEVDVPFTSAVEAMSDVLRLDDEIRFIKDIADLEMGLTQARVDIDDNSQAVDVVEEMGSRLDDLEQRVDEHESALKKLDERTRELH
nr:hypothetical protein [Halomicrobium zhouii]